MSLDYIFRRRSIRAFTGDDVSESAVHLLLEAAMAAPSAHNRKPWHFIVIRKREILDHIAELHPYAKMLYRAPLAFAVCGDIQKSPRRWDQDCAAATENILLALPELGLGGVWIGYHPRDEEKNILHGYIPLPPNIKIFCFVAVGRPAEEKQSRTQFEESCVHCDRW